MNQANTAFTTPLPLPATPKVLAQSVGTAFVPCVYENGRIRRLPRKAKTTPD
jgi:hypothetical protein